jgi:hypothetical protein
MLTTSPLSIIVIEFYGGAASKVEVSDTAFAQRKKQYFPEIMTQWKDPELI